MRRRLLVPALVGLLAAGGCAPPDPPPVPPPAGTHAVGALRTPTGVVAPILNNQAGGFWVRTPCYGIGWVSGGELLTGADVVLDPGHGGPERGARGPAGLEEGALNLAVAEAAAARLRARGIDVVLTRDDDDHFLTLRTRAELATALEPRAFVSIHHNAVADGPSSGPGTESFHQIGSEDGLVLATDLYEDVRSSLATFDGVDWVGNDDAGPKTREGEQGDYYGVLRLSVPVPAAIIEAAFIDNPSEEALLAGSAARDAEAEAIADAIVRYLSAPDGRGGSLASTPTDPTEPAGDADGCVDPSLE